MNKDDRELVERLLTDDWRDPVRVQLLRDEAANRIMMMAKEIMGKCVK